jgi:hypothetical protein
MWMAYQVAFPFLHCLYLNCVRLFACIVKGIMTSGNISFNRTTPIVIFVKDTAIPIKISFSNEKTILTIKDTKSKTFKFEICLQLKLLLLLTLYLFCMSLSKVILNYFCINRFKIFISSKFPF